ncbi:uncharacterized protein LOC134716833 [Mytilus trossulus]|uniref:uncharacterized protein LOC134716833 n=1 Tax=Mytilus trossulus TaxID=6551 RepID=UPI0030072526
MSESVTDSDACGKDSENCIPQNVQNLIRNLDISTIESINSTEELLEIKVKSVEDEDILTEIESALARKIGEIVMIPIQRLKFTSSLVEELFRQELKEKSISLMRDETNIFIVGFEKMKSYICKNIDEINRVTAKKVVKLEDKWKTEAVKCFGIAETIGRTFTDVAVRLQEDNSSVYLKGRDITISKAEKEVHKLLSDLFNETLHFDPLILKLLMCKEVSELLKQNLQKEQLQVVWTVDSTHLYFISKTKINTDALKAVVYENFLATGFSKTSQNENNFCNSSIFVDITKKQNKKLLFLETTNSSVNIAGTKSLMLHLLQQEKLFYNGVENEICNEQMIMHVADDNCLLRPYGNDRFQLEESSGDSFEITGATNQPEGATIKPPNYDDISPCESMPMPGPTFQQQLKGDQGQQPYGPYPGPGYLNHNPHHLPPYGGHSTQTEIHRPPSHPDDKIPKSEHAMNRPPGEKMPKIEYPYGPGVYNPHVPGEYNQHKPGEYIPPGAYMPPGHWPYQYYRFQEQNTCEKKGPDDVQGPSVQPYHNHKPVFPGNPGYPVYQNYPYPYAGDIGIQRPGQEQTWQPPEYQELTTIESPGQNIKMIKVSNIPSGTAEDAIRFFFENKRKSGGGEIEDLDYDEDSYSAIISFEEDDVAERVISRMPLLFEKTKIDVEIFVPRPATPYVEDDAQISGDEDTTDMPTEFVIEVRGMKPTTSEDTIRYYFESRKVANADVVKMQFIEEKEMYMIWFEEESAIDSVMGKSRLRIDGSTVNVKRHIPPHPSKYVSKYDNKVYITCISPTTTKNGLENFLQFKSKCISVDLIYGETEGTAIVTFAQPPDIEKLQTACMKRQLDGSHLSIHTVPITDCIVVTGYKDNTSSDTMEYYFNNKRRSGVEGVREVKLVEDEGRCVVYFTNPDSAVQVCNRQHNLEGRTLSVQLYYECLNKDA